MNQELTGILEQITHLLAEHRQEQLRSLLGSLHPADLAEVLQELDDDQRTSILRHLSDEVVADSIAELDPDEQASILKSLGRQRAGDVLEEMSADDVADLVGELPPVQAGELMQLLDVEDATDVRELLEFPPDTAGGIMTTEFVSLPASLNAQGAIEQLRKLAPEVETAYYVYVVNEREQLVGVLSLRELIIASPDTPVREIMRTQVFFVRVRDDQEAVARTVKRYDLLAVPVVDEQERLRGIVTVDDIMDVLEEEATEDIYRAAGVGEEEQDLDPVADIYVAVRSRLPWLLGLLFLSLVSGRVIEHFNSLIATVGALSFFITTMAGGSGNAATQSLTVVVRGLATGEIDRQDIWAVVWREVRVGLVIGLVCGAVMGVTGVMLQGSLWVGLIAGVALFINLTLAKVAGTLVPFLTMGLGLDPAVASGPFIATITDTTSMLVYFGIASAVLRYAGVA